LDEPNAQFTIRVKAQGTKITLTVASNASPAQQDSYEAIDGKYSGGTFGFAAENNAEFYVIGPLNVLHIDNSLKK
jgi:hypothetical protein